MSDKNPTFVSEAEPAGREDLSGLFRERARILSEVPPEEPGGEKVAALSFQLAGEVYGVELKYLAETRRDAPLRRLPGVVPHLAGVMNLRGELIPVVDLRLVLGLGRSEAGALAAALLVLSLKRSKLALAVDRTPDILNLPAKDLQPPPVLLDSERAIFIRGVHLTDGRLMNLLDVEKIIADPRFAGETHESP